MALTRKQGWGVTAAVIGLVAILVLILSLMQIRRIAQFNQALEKERYEQAAEDDSAYGVLVKAYLYQQRDEFDEAVEQYRRIEHEEDPLFQHKVRYNMATLIGDQKVSRLEQAKFAAWQTIQRLPCDSETGFAVFTEHRSFLLLAPVEICAHYRELREMLDRIDWQMAWRSRSEVNKGLISALKIGAALDPPARILFFSDGHEAPPVHPELRLMPEPVDTDIRSAIIGVGGDQPRPIPKFDLAGKKIGYWRMEDVSQIDVYSTGRFGSGEKLAGIDSKAYGARVESGREHLSSLRETWLRQLAGEAGLEYARLHSAAQTARFLNSPAFAERRVAPTDIRWLLGAAGLLLLVLVYAPNISNCLKQDDDVGKNSRFLG